LTVVTSDSVGLQESIGVSGDRQSAMELERRAAAIARTSPRSIAPDDYELYQAHQEQQRPGQRPGIQHEVTRNVSIDNTLGIGF
jgi:hypothetical protein